jgi:hypothetical protein
MKKVYTVKESTWKKIAFTYAVRVIGKRCHSDGGRLAISHA